MRALSEIRRDAAELGLPPEEFGRYVEENLEALYLEEALAERPEEWEGEPTAQQAGAERRA